MQELERSVRAPWPKRSPAIVTCLAAAGATLLALDLLHGFAGFGSAARDEAFALWFHPVVFLGAAVLHAVAPSSLAPVTR